ncbi:MAG: arsenate reductase (glutaredoxin) [Flavobacteriaceae bacterium]
MIEIYHNPRCSKSREALNILENENVEFKVIKYLDEPLSDKKLSEIIKLLKIKPIQLVRKNESLWKDHYKSLTLSDKELIDIMIKNPKLIERPIVINGKKAIIGRPPQAILDIV